MDVDVMRFHKIVIIFSLVVFFLGQWPINAATVDYDRYRGDDHTFRVGPTGDNPSKQWNSSQNPNLYKQPINRQELQRQKDEMLVSLIQEAKDFTEGTFDNNAETFIIAIEQRAGYMKRSLPESPYKQELIKVLGDIKEGVSKESKRTPFLASKMIFDTLSTPMKEAFSAGLRMQADSFVQLKGMSPQKKAQLKFNEEYLKIALIQMLDEAELISTNRQQCLIQTQKTMEMFKTVLPASLGLSQSIIVYEKALRQKAEEQPFFPIVLAIIKRKMDPAAWKELISQDGSLDIKTSEEEWKAITGNGFTSVELPWTDPEAEKAALKKKKAEDEIAAREQAAEEKKKKAEAKIAAQEQAAELKRKKAEDKIAAQEQAAEEKEIAAKKEAEKGIVEKQTDKLKEQATAQATAKGSEIANNLLGSIFGSGSPAQSGGGTGTAANALKGLFG